MKKLFAALLALVLALTMFCAASAAEECALKDCLAGIADPSGSVAYTLSTTEYGPLDPADCDPEAYVNLLLQMELEPLDLSLTPDGEYVVLMIGDGEIRFDFFLGEGGRDLIRQVMKDGTETLYRAVMPEGLAAPADIMQSWYDFIAEAHGLTEPVEAELPDAGWVRDALEGTFWASDRASLEVFLEDTDNYKVLITWSDSAWITYEWVYSCEYDPAVSALFARRMILDRVTYDDSGAQVSRENVSDQESAAVFFVNDRDELIILNAGDESLEKKVFSKVSPEAPAGLPDMAGWTLPEAFGLTGEEKAAFERAAEQLTGVDYVPLCCLAEKDGVRCYLARARAVYPEALPYYSLVYISESGIRNIWDLWIGRHAQ